MLPQGLVIKFPPMKVFPQGVHTCPRCNGRKVESDGSILWSPKESRIRYPSKCNLCDGSGLVKIEAYNNE